MEVNHRQISSQMIQLIFYPEMDPIFNIWKNFMVKIEGLSIRSLKVSFFFALSVRALQACLNEPLDAKTIPKEV